MNVISKFAGDSRVLTMFGLLGCAVYVGSQLWRKRPVNLPETVQAALAIVGVLGGLGFVLKLTILPQANMGALAENRIMMSLGGIAVVWVSLNALCRILFS
jgi:hypothetical protein